MVWSCSSTCPSQSSLWFLLMPQFLEPGLLDKHFWEVKTQNIKSINRSTDLERYPPIQDHFAVLFDSNYSGSQGPLLEWCLYIKQNYLHISPVFVFLSQLVTGSSSWPSRVWAEKGNNSGVWRIRPLLVLLIFWSYWRLVLDNTVLLCILNFVAWWHPDDIPFTKSTWISSA